MPRRSAKGSPEIDIEGRISGFVRRIRGFATGREIRMFKYQLASLSSTTVRLAMFRGEHEIAINTLVITHPSAGVTVDSLGSSRQQPREEVHKAPFNLSRNPAHYDGPRRPCVARK
jgi:hypothetical protein